MNYCYTDNGYRRNALRGIKRLVIKIGTNLLRHPNASNRIQELIEVVAGIRERGIDVILVSSGAIGVAMTMLGLNSRPKQVARVQGLAALGQCHLMSMYEKSCANQGFHCAQLLLTAADLQDFERNRHVTNCLEALLQQNILPVINENDSVCVDEIKIGDNDSLAAYVASMLRAELTILLTTVDGLRELDEQGNLGKRISVVTALDDFVLKMARGTDGNQFSTGGMRTKLHAAGIIMNGGAAMAIANGEDFSILTRVLNGDDIGTMFVPAGRQMHREQRMLAFFSTPHGAIIIDDGAAAALIKNNRSLLPGGIIGVKGAFRCGEAVAVQNAGGQEIARGIVNFDIDELAKICGAKTADIAAILGRANAPSEAIHKDHLVVVAPTDNC